MLEGEFEDVAGLKAKLEALEGVRSVIINDTGYRSAAGPDSEQVAIEETAEVVAEPAMDSSAQDTAATQNDAPAEAVTPDSSDEQAGAGQPEAADSGSDGALVSVQETQSESGEPLAQVDPESVPETPGDEAVSVEPADSIFSVTSL